MINLTLDEKRFTLEALEILWKRNNKRAFEYEQSDIPRKQEQAKFIKEQNKSVESARHKITDEYLEEYRILEKEFDKQRKEDGK